MTCATCLQSWSEQKYFDGTWTPFRCQAEALKLPVNVHNICALEFACAPVSPHLQNLGCWPHEADALLCAPPTEVCIL